MNKKIMSGILAVSMLLTGCSGISQSDYDSLVSENSDLKAKNEQLNATYDAQSKKYNALESDYEKLESDYAALESDIAELKGNNPSSTNDDNRDVDSSPQSSEANTQSSNITGNIGIDLSQIAPVGSDEYNHMVEFINFSNGFGSDSELYSVSVGGDWENDTFSIYTYYYNVKKYSSDGIVCYYAMIYVDDESVFSTETNKFMDNIMETLDKSYLGIEQFSLYINDKNNQHIVNIGNDGAFGPETPCIYWYTSEAREKYGQIENLDVFEGYDTKVVY